MKKLLIAALISLLTLTTFTGCDLTVNGKGVLPYDRPALGPTIEKSSVERVDPGKLTDISIDTTDGNIALTSWDKEYIEVTTVKRFTAPASRKTLEKLMDSYTLETRKLSYEIHIKTTLPEKQRFLSRFTADMILKLPKNMQGVTIKAGDGAIDVSGFEKASLIDLTLENGKISVRDCKSYRLDVSLKKGKLDVGRYEGKGNIKLSYAEANIEDLTGDLDFGSISGDSVIAGSKGKMTCSIARGRLELKEGYLVQGSTLYTSFGDIEADISGLDRTGRYDFNTSSGSVTLRLPAAAGFVLKAGTGNGRVLSSFTPAGAKEARLNGAKLTGTVGTGGPDINIFTDNGNVYLEKQPG